MNENSESFPDITLDDERVLLRPLEESDFDNLLPLALSETGLWFYSLVRAEGKEGLKNYLEIALKEKKANREFPFIVFDKKTNEFAGSTRFYDINFPYKTIQLGYTWYGRKFHGTNLNKHCKFLLLQFAFEKLNLERVEFRADARNETSIAAMKSIGCTVEGILRKNMPTVEGSRRDSIILSILKDEWYNDVKVSLRNKLA